MIAGGKGCSRQLSANLGGQGAGNRLGCGWTGIGAPYARGSRLSSPSETETPTPHVALRRPWTKASPAPARSGSVCYLAINNTSPRPQRPYTTPCPPIASSDPGMRTWLGPSAQPQVSVTRYQFTPLPGVGSVKFTLALQPL